MKAADNRLHYDLLGPLTGTVEYEPGTNRPAGARFEKAGGARVFAEAVRWKPNDLKKAVARGDLNDRSVGFTYGGANRLKVAASLSATPRGYISSV